MSFTVELEHQVTLDDFIRALKKVRRERGGEHPVTLQVDDDYYSGAPTHITALSLGKGKGQRVDIR